MTPLLPRHDDSSVREAAWVARCVARSDTVPLTESDLTALASYLTRKEVQHGDTLFKEGDRPSGVWIVREGMFELVVGSGKRKLVVQMLHAGDVDGDVQLLLEMDFPYTARAAAPGAYLYLDEAAFERLLTEHPKVARRWLQSVATRVATSQNRILGLLGRSLPAQIASLLADEAIEGHVRLPQRTLAAMLGVHRPSLNKVLKNFEKRGWIEVGYASINLLDESGLARVAAKG